MTLVSSGLINPWSAATVPRRHAAEQGILDLAQGHWKMLYATYVAAQQQTFGVLSGAANAAEKLGYSQRPMSY